MSPARILIALAVASQESRFTNYANDGRGSDISFLQTGISASLRLPHEAVGSDHGSVGVFQQQWPWWGTLPDLMNPPPRPASSTRHACRCLAGNACRSPSPRSRSRRSAYPDAYADDEAVARQLLGAGRGGATPVDAIYYGSTATAAASRRRHHGRVTFPLPRGAYVDHRNWGGHGSHWCGCTPAPTCPWPAAPRSWPPPRDRAHPNRPGVGRQLARAGQHRDRTAHDLVRPHARRHGDERRDRGGRPADRRGRRPGQRHRLPPALRGAPDRR